MEIKEIEVDSSYRNRNLYPNPFLFEIQVNVAQKIDCISANDIVCLSAPQIIFTGNTLTPSANNITSLTGIILRIIPDAIEVNFPSSIFTVTNYYKGLTSNPNNETIIRYEYVENNIGRFFLYPFNFSYTIGGFFTMNYWPNIQSLFLADNIVKMFIPYKPSCNEVRILYNETKNNWNEIIVSDDVSVTVLIKETNWNYDDTFSLRDEPPSWFGLVLSNTLNTITVNVVDEFAQKDVVFVPSINYFGKIISKNLNIFTVTPNIPSIILPNSPIQCLRFSYDNSNSLQYIGTPDQQQRTWIMKLISVQIPNILLKQRTKLLQFSHLYLEFKDTSSPQYNIMSNNPNSNNSYFTIFPSKLQSQREWISYDCDGSEKTIRFSPTTTEFKFSIISPDGNVLEFLENDNVWPKKSLSRLQIKALFNVRPFV